jgi:hypothetical protein
VAIRVSAAKPSERRTGAPPADVTCVRERLEAHAETRERAAYRSHAAVPAMPGDARLAPAPDAFEDLTSGDLVEPLRRARDTAARAESRDAWQRLLGWVEDLVLADRVRTLRAELQGLPQGGATPEGQADIREQILLRTSEERAKLGYATGRARAEARLPGLDVAGLAAGAARLLAATEALYRQECREVLPHLGIDPAGPKASDALWLAHLGRRFDALFPAEGLRDCAAATLEGMSIELSRRPIAFDATPRDDRAPGVAWFPIRVPEEIAISHGAPPSPDAYASGFFAIGQALAASYVSPSLPIEQRRVHDRALARGFGWLFSDLLCDPLWLEAFPTGPDPLALARALGLRQLYAVRRCAGRVPVALALADLPAGADPRRLAERYVEDVAAATHFEVRPPTYLDAVDAELGVLAELRGRCLAASLGEHLRLRFGRRFWTARGAGELLKEIWNTGSTYTADALAAALGLGPLEPARLADAAFGGTGLWIAGR